MKLMETPTLLVGDNMTPGLRLSPEVQEQIPVILKACRDFGLDFYDTVVEPLTYDEISEIAAYGGFPVRYPHHSFGEEYERMSRGYEYGMHVIYEMVVNCLDPDARVPSKRGTLRAGDVKAGDIVFAGNGPRTVAKVVTQPKAATVGVRLKGRTHPLRCTPNHRWLAVRDAGLTWVEAKDLVTGDVLVGGDTYKFHKNAPASWDWKFESVVESTRPNVRSRLKEVSPPNHMTLELAGLLGAITGDGSQGVVSRENVVSVVVGHDVPDYLDHVIGLFRKVFGGDVTLENKESVVVASYCSKAAVDFIDRIGLPAGCTYETKRVPWSIWASSGEFRAAFLRNLFDTDGYALDTLGMSCYNGDLADDVQLLLAEMGIQSKVDRVDNDHNHIWKVTVYGRESLFKFRHRIGFTTAHKAEGLSRLTDTQVCVGGGADIPYLRKRIVEIADRIGITSYSDPSLGRSVNSMRKNPVGLNAVYGFIMRAFEAGYNEFAELYPLVSNPLHVVEAVEAGPEMETVDIALFDDTHDFMADGVLSHNTNPCYLYILNSNALVDHVTVIAHATGHNDFFKNNVYFSQTSQNMMNELANHGSRIRRYMAEWGDTEVGRFVDKILAIESLIDPAAAWDKRVYRDRIINQKREYQFPRRLRVDASQEHMEDWVNPPEYIEQEKERIRLEELGKTIGLFTKPEKNILKFVKDHAPLKGWQQDIASMLYEEAMYFAPQRQTKVLNEGWASFVDSQIMARWGFAYDNIFEYAQHKAGVLGGKYSMNPYKLGYCMFLDIEERYNKGRHGFEYENCEDNQKKETWDTKAGKGHEKVFEVRKLYNDLTAISEFVTQPFVDKYELFQWKEFPDGSKQIVSKDAKDIRKSLINRHLNGGYPEIKLVDPNHQGKGILLLEHGWIGRTLHPNKTTKTLIALSGVWGKPVYLSTKDKDGNPLLYKAGEDKAATERASA